MLQTEPLSEQNYDRLINSCAYYQAAIALSKFNAHCWSVLNTPLHIKEIGDRIEAVGLKVGSAEMGACPVSISVEMVKREDLKASQKLLWLRDTAKLIKNVYTKTENRYGEKTIKLAGLVSATYESDFNEGLAPFTLLAQGFWKQMGQLSSRTIKDSESRGEPEYVWEDPAMHDYSEYHNVLSLMSTKEAENDEIFEVIDGYYGQTEWQKEYLMEAA